MLCWPNDVVLAHDSVGFGCHRADVSAPCQVLDQFEAQVGDLCHWLQHIVPDEVSCTLVVWHLVMWMV